jgi:hypothetical protein
MSSPESAQVVFPLILPSHYISQVSEDGAPLPSPPPSSPASLPCSGDFEIGVEDHKALFA